MRVSLISTAACYPETDALARLASTLLRRGDQVQLFTSNAGVHLPQPLPDLAAGTGVSAAELLALHDVRSSDLFIYHCVAHDPLLETLLELERGVVVLWLQPTTPLGSTQVVSAPIVRLASAADLVVVDDNRSAEILQVTGAVEPERVHIVPPPVSLADFAPELPDLTLRNELGLFGKRVLLYVQSPNSPPALVSVLALLAGVRRQVEDAVLAVASRSIPETEPSRAQNDGADIISLPATEDLRPYYRLADICLCDPDSSITRQRTLEAMACGVPVISPGSDEDELVERTIRLLNHDAAYGEEVRRSLATAAQHSLEVFARAWGAVVADACGWLPVRLAPESETAQPSTAPATTAHSQRMPAAPAIDPLGIDTEQLKSMASVTLRDYEVRSPTPFFGPFIAWVRRNLTSHLRKPYLDPTLDRQEAFNLRAASTLEELATRLAAYQQAVDRLGAQPAAIDPRVVQLLEQVEHLVDTIAVDDESHRQAGVIREALMQIHELLVQPPGGRGPHAEE